MVMPQVKAKIIRNMTKFQIWTKTGQVTSVIALYSMFGLAVLIQLYDISKFFDMESLRDGMNAIYNCGIRGKMYRLIYNMNNDTQIRVRTAVGETEEKETGENFGQGALEGASISAVYSIHAVNMLIKTSKD